MFVSSRLEILKMMFLQYLLFPGVTAITIVSYPLGFIAEFGLSLWLLVKGKQEKPAFLAETI
jgi:hypothetical protein